MNKWITHITLDLLRFLLNYFEERFHVYCGVLIHLPITRILLMQLKNRFCRTEIKLLCVILILSKLTVVRYNTSINVCVSYSTQKFISSTASLSSTWTNDWTSATRTISFESICSTSIVTASFSSITTSSTSIYYL